MSVLYCNSVHDPEAGANRKSIPLQSLMLAPHGPWLPNFETGRRYLDKAAPCDMFIRHSFRVLALTLPHSLNVERNST